MLIAAVVCGIILYVVWEIFRPEVEPVAGVYRLPGRFYTLKKALFYCIYKLRQYTNQKKKDAAWRYDRKGELTAVEDVSRGYGAGINSAAELEQTVNLNPDPYGIDAVYYGAFNRDGQRLAIRMGRRHGRSAEVWLVLEIPGIGILQHPLHPDTLAVNASSGEYRAGGLKIEMVEAMQKWKISFNGLLRFGLCNDIEKKQEIFLHTKFSFTWRAMSDPFNFDTDIEVGAIADGIAREKWTRQFFSTLRREHQTHYEQWGELSGNLAVEGHDEKFLRFKCVRDHSFGIRDWRRKYRYAIHFIFVESGLMIQTGVVSMPDTMSHLKIGYLIYPCGETWPVSDIDLKLWEVAKEEGPTTHYSFNFMAGKLNYHVEVIGETTPIWYHHDDRGSKVYEMFCQYKVNGRDGYGLTEFHYRNFEGPSYTPPQSTPLITVPSHTDLDLSAITLTFESAGCCDPALVGGKGAQLGLLTRLQEKVQGSVPKGFCLTLAAFNLQIMENSELKTAMNGIKMTVQSLNFAALPDVCADVVKVITVCLIHPQLMEAILKQMETTFGKSHEEKYFAVRSSAAGEDGSEASSAGQMETFLGVKGLSQMIDAVKKCWASAFTFQAVQYRRHCGLELVVPVAVVIQEMVRSEVAGVLFTNHPVTGSCNHMTIDASYGLGEAVVSGKTNPDCITVLRTWDRQVEIQEKKIGQKDKRISMKEDGGVEEMTGNDSATCCLNDEQIIHLSHMCIKIEEYLGSPRDVEWAMSDGKFYLLQARPITTLERETEEDLMHEFDNPLVTDREWLTTGNIGEMMPGAITPLTYSTFKKAIDQGLMEYGSISAKCATVKFPAKQVLTYCGHNFINMTGIGGMAIYNIHGKKEAAEMNLLGQILPDLTLQEVKEYAGNVRTLFTRFVTTFLYIFRSWRKVQICDSWQSRLQNYTVGEGATDCMQLYRDIDEKLKDYFEIWETGIIKSANSGVWSATVVGIVSEGKTEYEPQHWSDIALLLSKCEDVYSAEVPNAIQSLVREIVAAGLEERFLAASEEDCVGILKNKDYVGLHHQFTTFLDRHGHRYIREAELLERSWKSDPVKLVPVLKAILKTGSYETKKSTGLDVEEAMKQIQTPLPWITRIILKRILIKSRKAVGQRELGKSISVHLSDKFKEAYWTLADMMTREGRLPEKDLLFFLTHAEIGQLLHQRSPRLVTRAVRRKKLLPKLMKLKFPKLSVGLPVPVQEEDFAEKRTSSFALKGLPVCTGQITGIARVVKDLQNADTIQKDDILIVSFTDVGWSPYFPLIAGLVTEMGGLVSHGAVVAREYGIPCLVNVPHATQMFQSGDNVRLDGVAGTIEKLL